jgi:hypothetical protein
LEQKITFTNADRLSTEFRVPVTLEVPLVPVAVRVWVWVARAEPVKVSAGTVPAPPVNMGAATVPAGVMDATPPEGLAVVAVIESPEVIARAEPPTAVEVMTWVPVMAAVVPP